MKKLNCKNMTVTIHEEDCLVLKLEFKGDGIENSSKIVFRTNNMAKFINDFTEKTITDFDLTSLIKKYSISHIELMSNEIDMFINSKGSTTYVGDYIIDVNRPMHKPLATFITKSRKEFMETIMADDMSWYINTTGPLYRLLAVEWTLKNGETLHITNEMCPNIIKDVELRKLLIEGTEPKAADYK